MTPNKVSKSLRSTYSIICAAGSKAFEKVSDIMKKKEVIGALSGFAIAAVVGKKVYDLYNGGLEQRESLSGASSVISFFLGGATAGYVAYKMSKGAHNAAVKLRAKAINCGRE